MSAAVMIKEISKNRNLEYNAGSRPQKLKVRGIINIQHQINSESDLAVIS
jgi:hypothetical protein